MDILRSLCGIVFLLLIAYVLSTNRSGIRLRTLIPALLAQVSIGALVLFVPLGSAALAAAARGVNNVLQMGDRGVSFMFGGLVDAKMFQLFGGGGFYLGGPAIGGGGVGLILLVCLVIFLMGGFRAKS